MRDLSAREDNVEMVRWVDRHAPAGALDKV
jgi:hypothetical protein